MRDANQASQSGSVRRSSNALRRSSVEERLSLSRFERRLWISGGGSVLDRPRTSPSKDSKRRKMLENSAFNSSMLRAGAQCLQRFLN